MNQTKTTTATSRRIKVRKDFWKNEKDVFEMTVGLQFTEYLQHGVFYEDGHCNREGVGLDLSYFAHKQGEKFDEWFKDKFDELEPIPTRETEYFKMVEGDLRKQLRDINVAMEETEVRRTQLKNMLEVTDEIRLGSLVTDRRDIKLSDVAVVVYDCGVDGYDGTFMIKRVSDGHLSTRDAEELREVAPLDFCRKWCEDQVGYGTKERWEEYARRNEEKRKKGTL